MPAGSALGRGDSEAEHIDEVPQHRAGNTGRIAGIEGDNVVVRIDGEARISAAVQGPGQTAEPLLHSVPSGGIVDPNHNPGVGITGQAIDPEKAVRIIDKGDLAGYQLNPFFNQHIPGNDVAAVGAIGGNGGKTARSAQIAEIGFGQSRFPQGAAGRRGLVE